MSKSGNLITCGILSTLLCGAVALSTCSAQVPNVPAAPAPAKINWKFHCEQEWIIDSIGRDIAEMLFYAKYHTDPKIQLTADSLQFKTSCLDKKANKYKFEFIDPSTKTKFDYEFALADYVWNPANYVPLANKIQSALALKSNASSTVPSHFLKALSDASMESIWKENDRVSSALSATPLDPSLHEQAAMLQGTFDMLEISRHSDTRAPLNRMAAHLALAEALNGGTALSIVGKIADVALESMSCRDGVSAKENDQIAKDQTDPIVKSFLRGLKIRSTGNYHLFDEAHQTPIEGTQFGLRYGNYTDANTMSAYIDSHPKTCVPKISWMRLSHAGGDSVGTGSTTQQLFVAELNAFRSDYDACHKEKSADIKSIIPELNKSSNRCLVDRDGPCLVVLSWDDAAAFHARQILDAVDSMNRYLEQILNVPDQAAATIAQMAQMFSKIQMLPIALVQVPMDEKHKPIDDLFLGSMQNLIANNPEKLQAGDWLLATHGKRLVKPPVVLPDPDEWFDPPYPFGTAYYYAHRKYMRNNHPDLTELTKLRDLCPLDASLCLDYANKKYGEHATVAQLREAFGPLAEYDQQVMYKILDAAYDDPTDYLAQGERISKINPAELFFLGMYCAQHDQDEKAAKYYERAIELTPDSVSISNYCEWLVRYYYSHGQKDKALELAKQVADVYSANGLGILARLYELMGEVDKAESILLQAEERYGASQKPKLAGFYVRNAEKKKEYAVKAEAMTKEIFPYGLQKFNLADLHDAPKSGVVIVETSKYPESKGLLKERVIVGLNGYKTDNTEQYYIVQNMPLDPNIKATFWDGKQYNEATIKTVMQNKLNLGILDYPLKPL